MAFGTLGHSVFVRWNTASLAAAAGPATASFSLLLPGDQILTRLLSLFKSNGLVFTTKTAHILLPHFFPSWICWSSGSLFGDD